MMKGRMFQAHLCFIVSNARDKHNSSIPFMVYLSILFQAPRLHMKWYVNKLEIRKKEKQVLKLSTKDDTRDDFPPSALFLSVPP